MVVGNRSSEVGSEADVGDRRPLAGRSLARRSEVSGVFSSMVFSTGVGCRRSGVFSSKVFSSDVGGRKSEVFGSEVEARRLEVGSQRSEVGGRTRERDGGLQPPIERLVYIYIYTNTVRGMQNTRHLRV